MTFICLLPVFFVFNAPIMKLSFLPQTYSKYGVSVFQLVSFIKQWQLNLCVFCFPAIYHSGVAKARVMAYFGEGTGPIHVDNVKCSGEERSLADCIKQPPGTHNCRHSEDAGVICDYGESQHSYQEVKGQYGLFFPYNK